MDAGLEQAAQAIIRADPGGRLFAATLRRSFDMLLDGQHTGRYRWDQLDKTEKTHAGTLVEINLQRAFGFADGNRMDYSIAGMDVDCKYSQTLGAWMIPPEAHGQVLLVVWANDAEGKWSAGLVRALPELLNAGGNRDGKRTLNIAGRSAIRWIFAGAPLPENVLLRIPEEDAEAIFADTRNGQRRVDELFRRVQRRRISRTVVATVAMQEDYMKRVRYDGGARSNLQAEGIMILGQYRSHRDLAERLGIPVPQAGESVSVRLAPYSAHHVHLGTPWAILAGRQWTVALPQDPPVTVPGLPFR